MRDVVIVDFARTAFGNQGGGLRSFSGAELATECLKGLLEKSEILKKGATVDSLVAGAANPDKYACSQTRYIAIGAGLPYETETHMVEMQCGSGITSINHAAIQIGLGYADIAIAGGMESLSTKPAFISQTNAPYRVLPPKALTMHYSPFPEEDIQMLAISDNMAKLWGITREECDEFAVQSQMRLQDAYKKGITGPEIIPITVPATRKTPEKVITKDEYPKPNTTLENLAKLKPINADGVSTAGNSSGLNDGASFVLMMTAEKAKELGYEPYAKWVMGADIGVRPSLMGIGPAYSTVKALKLAGLSISDMSVIECNEAFAAQNLSVIKEIENQTSCTIDRSLWNPNGGAIAIGHPNGASGGRIGIFAMKQLEQTGGKYGVFCSCCGGGHGVSAIIENLRV